jgi:hypothetical protein
MKDMTLNVRKNIILPWIKLNREQRIEIWPGPLKIFREYA